MNKELNAVAFGYGGAIVSAGIMLLLGIFGNIGIYLGAVEMMRQWHILFSLSFWGIIGGMIEAGILTFVILYLFVALYNKLS